MTPGVPRAQRRAQQPGNEAGAAPVLGHIARPAEMSIPFLLDEKSAVVPVRLIHGFSRYSGVKRLRHIEAQHGLLIASLL